MLHPAFSLSCFYSHQVPVRIPLCNFLELELMGRVGGEGGSFLNKDQPLIISCFPVVGYQREQTYRHNDGSYSAFGGRDTSGSIW